MDDTRVLVLDPPGDEVHGPVLSRLDGGQARSRALVLAPDQDASGAHACKVQQGAVFLHRHLLARILKQHQVPSPDELKEILRREPPPEPED